MSDTGTIDIAEDQLLHFPDGIPGFPEAHRFLLVSLSDESAFQQLQSVDDPALSLIVCVPWIFFPDYTLELTDDEQDELGIESTDDAVVFCPVTLDAPAQRVYLNLLGPFVVNINTRRGRQLVLAESNYPVRAAIDLSSD